MTGPKRSSKTTTILMFLDDVSEPSLDKLTVEDVLHKFDWRTFEKYFDRSKILAYLEKYVKLFEEKILDRVFCPRCNSPNVKEISDIGSKEFYICLTCKRRFKPRSFVGSHFSNWVIASMLCCAVKGEKPQNIVKSLRTEATNRLLDFDCQEKIPDEKTLYDIIEKCARKLEKFNELMICLRGRLPCKKLFCDDVFALKRWKGRKRKLRYKKKSHRKPKERFYYAIVTMDADTRFIITLWIARFRDKSAFRVAFAETLEKLRNLPVVIRGDKLAAMEKAAEFLFPKNEVKHDFRQLKPWKKGELNKIERRIRDLRRTIRKHQKSGSKRVLINYAKIALIDLNYLKPMEMALKGNTPAQVMGIPYPLYQSDWRKFMKWVDWIFENISGILKVGLKQLSGTSLVPSDDANEKLFEERMKLKKRGRTKYISPHR